MIGIERKRLLNGNYEYYLYAINEFSEIENKVQLDFDPFGQKHKFTLRNVDNQIQFYFNDVRFNIINGYIFPRPYMSLGRTSPSALPARIDRVYSVTL